MTCASLMVAAPAAADAAARAKRLGLPVGLHVVLVEGAPVLPAARVPNLIGRDGSFLDDEVRAAVRFFFRPRARGQLAAEIRAQFEAFRETGLALDHVNGHKHVQVHPTVGRLIAEIGREYGMQAMRLPYEPAAVLRRAFPGETYRAPAYGFAVAALRRRLRRAGVTANDRVFGIAWSGAVVERRVLALLPHLPDGLSEIYSHPGQGAGELEALLSPKVRARIAELGIGLTSYAAL